MNYTLNKQEESGKKISTWAALKKMWLLVEDEKGNLIAATLALILNSILNLLVPVLIGYIIDNYIQNGQFDGVLMFGAVLLVVFILAFIAGYLQIKWMGSLAQRVLFKLRNQIFFKLQELPLVFFNQNKAGDLISRINNDTDKLNQFLSQSLMQFVGSLFMMLGAGIFILLLNPVLGSAALIPAFALLIFTQLISGWVKKTNARSLQTVGGMSAEIQESLSNFKVIVAFNRRNYFKEKFNEANKDNFSAAMQAGIANNIFRPVYDLAAYFAQLIVLMLGVYLIANGGLTMGLLISFILYVARFYDPVRQIAAFWSSFQTAMAAWDRISDILNLKSDLKIEESKKSIDASTVLEFHKVSFKYPDGKEVLTDINFKLLPGKTYALVGPTGGGKTTTASLMVRLYDPTEGKILLNGKDIKSYSAEERTKKIGFILQEPYLFSGTVQENILYGNENLNKLSSEELLVELKKADLDDLLKRFEKGLETPVSGNGDSISLGQRQLIAFMRAVLRKPDLLILDEATANIDTVTEKLLESILEKLPASTSLVVIAHRLNTIENADEIFFVNSGKVELAGSMEHAVEMLLHGKSKS
ncbi:MAG: ABC transporter ATP-binding protein [Candidatus Altimarinota bacterium]